METYSDPLYKAMLSHKIGNIEKLLERISDSLESIDKKLELVTKKKEKTYDDVV